MPPLVPTPLFVAARDEVSARRHWGPLLQAGACAGVAGRADRAARPTPRSDAPPLLRAIRDGDERAGARIGDDGGGVVRIDAGTDPRRLGGAAAGVLDPAPRFHALADPPGADGVELAARAAAAAVARVGREVAAAPAAPLLAALALLLAPLSGRGAPVVGRRRQSREQGAHRAGQGAAARGCGSEAAGEGVEAGVVHGRGLSRAGGRGSGAHHTGGGVGGQAAGRMGRPKRGRGPSR
jgi:hypothetical protein